MKTILLVDDEYGLVETLGELLEGEGYVVVSASNGKDGLLRAAEVHPDLVLTDFMMALSWRAGYAPSPSCRRCRS